MGAPDPEPYVKALNLVLIIALTLIGLLLIGAVIAQILNG